MEEVFFRIFGEDKDKTFGPGWMHEFEHKLTSRRNQVLIIQIYELKGLG